MARNLIRQAEVHPWDICFNPVPNLQTVTIKLYTANYFLLKQKVKRVHL